MRIQMIAVALVIPILSGCAGAAAAIEGAGAFANGYSRGQAGLPYEPTPVPALQRPISCMNLGSGIITCN
jgi:hypothetical protein